MLKKDENKKKLCSNSYMQKPEWSLFPIARVGDAFKTRLFENHRCGDIGKEEEVFWRLIITKQAQI